MGTHHYTTYFMVAMFELLRSLFLHDHFSCSSFTGGLLTLDLSSRLPLLSVQLEGAPFLQLFHGSFFNFYCLFLNPALLRLTLIRWHYLDFLNWLYSMSRSAAFRLAFQHRTIKLRTKIPMSIIILAFKFHATIKIHGR